MKLLVYAFFIVIVGCTSPEEEEISENTPEETGTIDIPEENPDQQDKSDEKESSSTRKVVSFIGVGDNLIHNEIFEYALTDEGSYDFKSIYENVAQDIQDADLSFINQETLFGGDDRPFLGYPAFNTPSDMAADLVETGFNLMSIANNHTLDMGVSGVLNMLNYLSEYDDHIHYTGAFETQEDRDEITLIEQDGIAFSFLAYTYGTNGLAADTSYRVNYFDPDLITQDVERAKEVSDFVIVSAHWGDEHAFTPNAMQEDYAQLFADLEVDVVVGHHSHTIQPLEWITGEDGNETLVIYSLGNFLASTTSDINLLGGMVSFDFVQEEDEKFIENVYWEPLVIHYENEDPQNIDTRSFFEIYKLEDYTEELANEHGVNIHRDNELSIQKYSEIIDEAIETEFLIK